MLLSSLDRESTPVRVPTGQPHVSRVEIAVIGAGFSGLGMAIKLLERGEKSFIVLERGHDVGGTWRENHYPGCACDIPAHLYSYSFAQNADWSRLFAPQKEIYEYLKDCARRYRVAHHVRFGIEVTRAAFDEKAALWRLHSGAALVAEARFLVLGIGALHRPQYPSITHLQAYMGRTFHSAEWDHSCDLAGKKVAVIGTGASAIQFVPQIAPLAEQLFVIQRTPPWIMPKPDVIFSSAWRAAFRRFPPLKWLLRGLIYTYLERSAKGYLDPTPATEAFAKQQALDHLDQQVHDPRVRKALTPDYQIGCKRVLISNDYLPTFNRPNVELVTARIQEATATGLRLGDGRLLDVDCIVYGTGFRVSDALSPMVVIGRGGRVLNDEWADGARAYLGVSVHGYPNMFMLMGPNTGLGHNSMIYMIETQVHHALDAIRLAREQQGRMIEVRADVLDRFDREVQSKLSHSVWASGCKSWYVGPSGRNASIWPDRTYVYRQRAWRARSEDYQVA